MGQETYEGKSVFKGNCWEDGRPLKLGQEVVEVTARSMTQASRRWSS